MASGESARPCARCQPSRLTGFGANFERALAHEARRRGLDGAVCGHIHRAEISEIDGVLYCNDGDWVESCTTLTEDFEGRLSPLRWTESKEVITHSGAPAPCTIEIEQAA